MGNEQSSNSEINRTDRTDRINKSQKDKDIDAFNKYMQQQIIKQTQNQIRSQSSNSQNGNITDNTGDTKNIKIYDKKSSTRNISRQHKQMDIEREQLRKREEALRQKEYLLNKRDKELQQQELRRQKAQQQKLQQNKLQKQNPENRNENHSRNQFKHFQQQRDTEFKQEINELKTIKVNPFQIFKIPENFTLEQLKKEYRNLALRYHPDRPNGDELKFKIVTKVYLALFEEYKNKQPDKQYLDLRNGSRDFISRQNNERRQNVKMDKEKFNLNLFNKIYDDNKLYTPNNDGYGKWLNDDTEIKKPPKLFSKSFNLNVFNTFFNDERTNYAKGREVVEYKDPEAQGTSMNYGNIGENKINDFSSNHNSDTQYSDLKKAYTDTFLVPSEEVTRQQYRGVNDIKRARSNISYTMSDSDKQRQTLINDRLKQEEGLRQQRVRTNDKLIEDHFNKMNNMFLGFR